MTPIKNCIIIHGCPENKEQGTNPMMRTYDKHWMPWVRKQLITKGIEVETPSMPEPWAPDYQKYVHEFEQYTVDENTVLVGHSCGCAFLVRWLGETKTTVAKLILVAPWKIPHHHDAVTKRFYTYPIDPSISERVEEIIMFTSDDEEDEGKESLRLFYEALGGEIIDLEDHGHYTLGDMKTEEFPELIEAILQ